MKTAPVRNPADVLKTLIVSEVEIIRNRDPELSAALDTPATVLKFFPLPAAPALQASLPRRALRKLYRTLDRVGPLRPILQRARSRVLVVLDRAPQPPTPGAGHTTVQRSYTIAFTMRSGSNEVCNLLAKNGLGTPGEFFQKPLPGGPGLILDSFSKVISRYQREGVFGSKMSHDHRAALDEQLRMAIPHYTRIDDVLPNHHWVWLVRQDKILQAISWCRAETSNRWAEPGTVKSKPGDYNYDFIHILSRVMIICSAELAWETYFRENRIEPFKVVYEEFFRDIDPELKALVDYLGGPGPGRKSLDKGSTFTIQRNERSYVLRQRFVNDLVRLGSKGLTNELGKPLNTWVRFFFERGWLA